jgi:hypothetical protein
LARKTPYGGTPSGTLAPEREFLHPNGVLGMFE